MRAIDTLRISHFKAFDEEQIFLFKGRNALVFGENGSGKTSVFDAFKLAFFHNRLENEKIFASDTPEDATEKRRQLYESYYNAKKGDPFSIFVNGASYDTLSRNDYKVFLITHNDFELEHDCIVLESQLGKLFFDYGVLNPQTLLETICDDLEVAVNNSLSEQFSETVKVTIDKGDRFRCVLSDMDGKLNYGTNLSHYYNEGKIHLILIIIYINAFLLLADKNKHNLLVLDDFITSLDATNRAFVLRFLFDAMLKQESLQSFILTHNVSFYNLTKHYINTYLKPVEKDNWTYMNLYNLGERHKLYPQTDDTIEMVEADLIGGIVPAEELGNRVRQLFEIQVHELAKIIISGGVEESKDILARIRNGWPIYFKSGKNVYDLMSALESIAKITTIDGITMSNKIIAAIDEYKNDPDLDNLRKLLLKMTLFQKVSLHPTSHGTLGLTPASVKEIKESIQLVKKIEDCIGKLKDKNVANV